MRLAALNGEAICECGHPASDHAEGYVCTHWMGEGPNAWYGVCPCVRRREDDFQPDPLPSLPGEDARR